MFSHIQKFSNEKPYNCEELRLRAFLDLPVFALAAYNGERERLMWLAIPDSFSEARREFHGQEEAAERSG